MTALDTNILVRYLTRDDLAQTRKAEMIINRAIADEEPLLVPDIVLCELIWVLARSYRFNKDRILSGLKMLYRAPALLYNSPTRLLAAIIAYETGPGDFADYLIRERALEAGCKSVVTFDRRLKGQQGFQVV
jgi:predicted nucleic-acid-binding protein